MCLISAGGEVGISSGFHASGRSICFEEQQQEVEVQQQVEGQQQKVEVPQQQEEVEVQQQQEEVEVQQQQEEVEVFNYTSSDAGDVFVNTTINY